MPTRPSEYVRLLNESFRIGKLDFLRQVARSPLEYHASRLLESIPALELVDVTGPMDFKSTILPREARHRWSLGVAEQYVIQALIVQGSIKAVFEIGTFNGATTRLIAECLPDDGHITTVDLPTEMFDATQSPVGFSGSDVGMAFRGSEVEHKITQVRIDSN